MPVTYEFIGEKLGSKEKTNLSYIAPNLITFLIALTPLTFQELEVVVLRLK